MTFLAAGKVNYRARIARAELLSSRHPFASEILTFYGQIASFQKQLYDSLPKLWGKQRVAPPDGSLRAEINLPILVQPFAAFLSVIEAHAPRPLAAQADCLKEQGTNAWATTLETFWKAGLQEWPDGGNLDAEHAPDPLKEFLARAFLQPYAEFVVAAMLPSPNSADDHLPLPALQFPSLARNLAAGGGRRETLSAVLFLFPGMGVSQNLLRPVRRRARRQIAGIYCRTVSTCSRGKL
jgi:hypothetical protein